MKNLQNKNALNIVLIALVLVVAACNCGKLQELSKQDSSTPTPADSPSTSNTTSSPTTTTKAGLTLEKYNKIKTGMTLKEVQDILGSAGEETSSSEIGKYKSVVYKWSGDNYSFIIATFSNDKLSYKSQGGLK